MIQVIQGQVSDRADIHEAVDAWARDLASAVGGWLGSTAGVTADEVFLMVNRFDSKEAAQQYNHRPEQHQWFTEISKLFVRDMAVHDCPLTDVIRGGASDGAAFVQVVQAQAPDTALTWALGGRADESSPARGPARLALGPRVTQLIFCQMRPDLRPDFIGGIAGFDPADNTVTEAAYFTSEPEAREGERKPLPPDLAALLQEWHALLPDARYYDLTEPWHYSPQ